MDSDQLLTLSEPHLPSPGQVAKILCLEIMGANVFCQLPMLCPAEGSPGTQRHLWEQEACLMEEPSEPTQKPLALGWGGAKEASPQCCMSTGSAPKCRCLKKLTHLAGLTLLPALHEASPFSHLSQAGLVLRQMRSICFES